MSGGWHVYPEQCAAGLWTTPGDLCRFAIGIQRAVAGADGAVVSAATADTMLSPQTPPSPSAERIGGLNAVGIGPFLRSFDGRTTYFGHSGGNEGFRCHLLAHRDDGYAACVMTNSDAGVPLVIDAFDAIATARGWSSYTTEPLDALPPRGAELDVFAGRFTSDAGLVVEIDRSGSLLDGGDRRPASRTVRRDGRDHARVPGARHDHHRRGRRPRPAPERHGDQALATLTTPYRRHGSRLAASPATSCLSSNNPREGQT